MDGITGWVDLDFQSNIESKKTCKTSDGFSKNSKWRGTDKFLIAFHGTITNKTELKQRLLLEGSQLYTDTVEELVLEAYIIWKESLCSKLRGTFAVVIWDAREKTLFLLRDQLGIEQLFYYKDSSKIVFASTLDRLLMHPAVQPVVSEQQLRLAVSFHTLSSRNTLLPQDITALPPGSFAKINHQGAQIHTYWALTQKKHTDTYERTSEKIRYYLFDAIEKQITHSSDTAIYLSGSMESAVMASIVYNYAMHFGQIYRLNTLKTVACSWNVDSFSMSNDVKEHSEHTENSYPRNSHLVHSHNQIDIFPITFDVMHSLLKTVLHAKGSPGFFYQECVLLHVLNHIKVHTDELFVDNQFHAITDVSFETTANDAEALWHKLLAPEFRSSGISGQPKSSSQSQSSLQSPLQSLTQSPLQPSLQSSLQSPLQPLLHPLFCNSHQIATAADIHLHNPYADFRFVEYQANIPAAFHDKNISQHALLHYITEPAFMQVSSLCSPPSLSHLEMLRQIALAVLQNSDSVLYYLFDIGELMLVLQHGFLSGCTHFYLNLLTYLIQLDYWFRTYSITII